MAFALVVNECNYLTEIHDNNSQQKDGHFALQQISIEITQVQKVFQVKVVAVYTDFGSDQVSFFI